MRIPQENTAKQYLKKLNDSQKNIVEKQENELKRVNTLFNKKVSEAKKDGEMKLYDTRERSQIEIANALQEKESKLEKISTELKDYSQKLEKERFNLTDLNQEKVSNMNQVFNEKFRDIYNDNVVKSREITDQTQEAFNKIKDNSDFEVKNANFNAKLRSDSITRENTKNIKNIEKVYKDRQDLLEGSHNDKIEQINKDFNVQMIRTERKHALDTIETENKQAKEIKTLEDHHQAILKQKRTSFEQKFASLESNHKNILDRIKERFDTDITNLVKKYSDFKKLTLEKAQDKFYNIKKIEPQVTDNVDHYLVSLKVPEHEKELVNLTAQERDLYISLTRKYTDKTEGLNKESYKTKRSEVLSKSFSVNDIMDSKSVVQKYDNEKGELTFKIAKR